MSKAIRRARQMGKIQHLILINVIIIGILPYMYRPKVNAVRNQNIQ